MTPAHSTVRATTTLARHAPPVREPRRTRQHPRRRPERRRPGPARACGPSRECAYVPRAPRDAIKCAWLQNDASIYRSAARSDHDASQGDAESTAGFDASCTPIDMSAWSAYRSEAALYTRYPTYRYDARRVQLSADSDCFDGTAYSLVEEIHVHRNGRSVLIKSNSAGSDEIEPADLVFVSVSSRRQRKADDNFLVARAPRSTLLQVRSAHESATDLPPDASAARRHPERKSPILNGDSGNMHADGPR